MNSEGSIKPANIEEVAIEEENQRLARDPYYEDLALQTILHPERNVLLTASNVQHAIHRKEDWEQTIGVIGRLWSTSEFYFGWTQMLYLLLLFVVQFMNNVCYRVQLLLYKHDTLPAIIGMGVIMYTMHVALQGVLSNTLEEWLVYMVPSSWMLVYMALGLIAWICGVTPIGSLKYKQKPWLKLGICTWILSGYFGGLMVVPLTSCLISIGLLIKCMEITVRLRRVYNVLRSLRKPRMEKARIWIGYSKRMAGQSCNNGKKVLCQLGLTVAALIADTISTFVSELNPTDSWEHHVLSMALQIFGKNTPIGLFCNAIAVTLMFSAYHSLNFIRAAARILIAKTGMIGEDVDTMIAEFDSLTRLVNTSWDELSVGFCHPITNFFMPEINNTYDALSSGQRQSHCRGSNRDMLSGKVRRAHDTFYCCLSYVQEGTKDKPKLSRPIWESACRVASGLAKQSNKTRFAIWVDRIYTANKELSMQANWFRHGVYPYAHFHVIAVDIEGTQAESRLWPSIERDCGKLGAGLTQVIIDAKTHSISGIGWQWREREEEWLNSFGDTTTVIYPGAVTTQSGRIHMKEDALIGVRMPPMKVINSILHELIEGRYISKNTTKETDRDALTVWALNQYTYPNLANMDYHLAVPIESLRTISNDYLRKDASEDGTQCKEVVIHDHQRRSGNCYNPLLDFMPGVARVVDRNEVMHLEHQAGLEVKIARTKKKDGGSGLLAHQRIYSGDVLYDITYNITPESCDKALEYNGHVDRMVLRRIPLVTEPGCTNKINSLNQKARLDAWNIADHDIGVKTSTIDTKWLGSGPYTIAPASGRLITCGETCQGLYEKFAALIKNDRCGMCLTQPSEKTVPGAAKQPKQPPRFIIEIDIPLLLYIAANAVNIKNLEVNRKVVPGLIDSVVDSLVQWILALHPPNQKGDHLTGSSHQTLIMWAQTTSCIVQMVQEETYALRQIMNRGDALSAGSNNFWFGEWRIVDGRESLAGSTIENRRGDRDASIAINLSNLWLDVYKKYTNKAQTMEMFARIQTKFQAKPYGFYYIATKSVVARMDAPGDENCMAAASTLLVDEIDRIEKDQPPREDASTRINPQKQQEKAKKKMEQQSEGTQERTTTVKSPGVVKLTIPCMMIGGGVQTTDATNTQYAVETMQGDTLIAVFFGILWYLREITCNQANKVSTRTWTDYCNYRAVHLLLLVLSCTAVLGAIVLDVVWAVTVPNTAALLVAMLLAYILGRNPPAKVRKLRRRIQKLANIPKLKFGRAELVGGPPKKYQLTAKYTEYKLPEITDRGWRYKEKYNHTLGMWQRYMRHRGVIEVLAASEVEELQEILKGNREDQTGIVGVMIYRWLPAGAHEFLFRNNAFIDSGHLMGARHGIIGRNIGVDQCLSAREWIEDYPTEVFRVLAVEFERNIDVVIDQLEEIAINACSGKEAAEQLESLLIAAMKH